MKKLSNYLFFVLLVLTLLNIGVFTDRKIELTVVNIIKDDTAIDTKIENKTMYILSPYITYGVNSFYGKERNIDFNNAKVIDFKSLAENDESYEITLQVLTSTPDLKGPYGIERITLLNELGSIKITNFIHITTTQKNPLNN